MEKSHVIRVSDIMPYIYNLLYLVIQIGEIKIRKILAKIVPDRNAGSGINDLIQQHKQAIVLDLLPSDAFQHLMVY